ncbi:hypothetical protein ASPZODRAFT_72400 [Penicilliopsis zonata CBS 506.65]|uniref:Peptidase M43 pregnancy-associated plasma-A domain-containing protein n=1 Tax=Penicilliopsis zonata CBS 506.65 TaxID=1073090 RepID=A0A1L9SAJ7_9EURO|nr:hypothetical protein ASPZODRAFT_72400 [Penicilliopsis zonata CBS 506.65]OJJ44203.1 hypothetical protein ASPZODRAFT_72400 [Penicilliopsis zonata CBS 506.65]
MHQVFLLHSFVVFIIVIHFNISSARGFCATSAPDERLEAEHKRLSSIERQANDGNGFEGRKDGSVIEIETWFHIVSSEEKSRLVSDAMISNQFAILQSAYGNTNISYRLQGVTHHVNDTWARNEDDLAMKRALRQGTYRTLNVYFQTDLQGASGDSARVIDDDPSRESLENELSSSVLGFCTLPDPSINASSPSGQYINDGCNILANTMPGGSITHYNLGGTAIHEIGHWNGLLHTFQGESCSPNNDGDYISDTPQESTPTDGCPSGKDSCPRSPGLDPVHNYMDYSSDDCYSEFTANQAQRMQNMWFSLREAK